MSIVKFKYGETVVRKGRLIVKEKLSARLLLHAESVDLSEVNPEVISQ